MYCKPEEKEGVLRLSTMARVKLRSKTGLLLARSDGGSWSCTGSIIGMRWAAYICSTGCSFRCANQTEHFYVCSSGYSGRCGQSYSARVPEMFRGLHVIPEFFYGAV